MAVFDSTTTPFPVSQTLWLPARFHSGNIDCCVVSLPLEQLRADAK
jgi:hypothetical protein